MFHFSINFIIFFPYRLAVLVDEFSVSFHPDPLVLNVYKKELHFHVESGLGSNLRARLSTALAMNIDSSQREMTENMAQLLPEKKRNLVSITKSKKLISYKILLFFLIHEFCKWYSVCFRLIH